MTILESWEDHQGDLYAIVRYSRQERQRYRVKRYEACWVDAEGELASFAGSVGFRIAASDTLAATQDFLLTGIAGCDDNPDIWWDMLAVS